ncbi:MAG: CrcB family protein [Phycisphaerales bacterium]|nr:CrcB family protein [Phycisphaerales bacterium]
MAVWISSIALGGAAGALLRWAIGHFISTQTSRPGWWATAIANAAGCLLIGLFAALPDLPEPLLVGGFCGALTTFSSLALDIAMLTMQGRYRLGACLALGSLTGGAGLVVAGLAMGGPL